MSLKIVRRKFTALKFEKGSPDRYKLNKSSLTSEFARKKVWLVLDDTNRPLKSFKSITECKEFMNNPDKFILKNRIKKYTRDKFLQTREFFEKKKYNLKTSLKF